ncbi:MAG: hypothetical protein NTW49_13325 [Bacteroidia bacterium]|nr:hypothetical protein [Bacteroidia bacterium]
MKLRLSIIIIQLFLYLYSNAQFDQEFFDNSFIKIHHIKLVKEFIKELTSETDLPDGELQQQTRDTGFVLNMTLKFNNYGEITDSHYKSDDIDNWDPRGGIVLESSIDIFDENCQLIEKLKYFDGVYSESLLYEYNMNGQLITEKENVKGKIYLLDSVSYDKSGNNILYINRFFLYEKSFDSQNRIITNKTYSCRGYDDGKLVRIDSTVYHSNGKVREQYLFNRYDDKLILDNKFIATYDSTGNISTSAVYRGKNLHLTDDGYYLYNDNHQIIKYWKNIGFENSTTTFKYNERGEMIQKIILRKNSYEILENEILRYEYEYY